MISMGLSSVEDDGVSKPLNNGKKLIDELGCLKTLVNDISAKMCSSLTKTSITDISSEDIKSFGPLRKKELGDFVLDLLKKCNDIIVCMDGNVESCAQAPKVFRSEALISGISSCIDSSIEKHMYTQNSRFVAMEKENTRLQSMVDSLLQLKSPVNLGMQSTKPIAHHSLPSQAPQPGMSLDVKVMNPTKCVHDYRDKLIPEQLSNTIHNFLDQCSSFSENTECGHSVALFGHPYHYVGSKHSNKATDIPAPVPH